ncbi:MAG: TonB-dependent receptor [Caulobacter sp.]|nr:TonB-dependent receptor [Caulobacter sp.]
MKASYLNGTTAIAAVIAASVWAAPALAMADEPTAAVEVQEFVVTGSRLLTSEQAEALPLRIVTAEELEKQGSPNLLDIIRAMPETAGSIGNSNSSQAGKGQGFEASESVNLRGLGPDRNLVLLNGRRLPLVSGFFVNTRNIPMSAVSRIEILKDAASTTYGSDAMTGVVNFITRRDFEGLEIGGSYTAIADTDGDYSLDATWGRTGDGWNLLVSGGYQSRARLRVLDRPWSTPDYAVNPDAGWNFSSNPGNFRPVGLTGPGGTLAPLAPQTVDAGCAPLGGIEPFAGFCVNNVQKWQDLVAPATTWQIYTEFNYDLTPTTELHLEAVYARSESRVHYPPSFNQPKPITETVLPSTINPASWIAGTSPRLFNNWYVPLTNPGLAAYAAANPAQFPAGSTGIFIPIGQWRPYLVGGNPFFGSDPANSAYQTRDQEQFRVSAGLTGAIGDSLHWNADITFGRNEHELKGFDSSGVMIELALRGLGGPACNWQTAAPGSPGCLWLNPMSNAIASAPINGVASNPGYNAAVANSAELANWLMIPQIRYLTSETTEANFGMDGAFGGLSLGGGEVRWAAGAQWRRMTFNEHDSEYADRTRVPCLNSPLDIPGADVCTPTPYTPLGLAAAFAPTDITTDIIAAFAEVVLPLSARSDITLGARYEDYGSDGGSTFDPQVRAKFQLTDWLALRGSASTTFRAPPQTALTPNPLASIPTILGKATALDLIGNPDLKPETATTYSVGLIVQAGGLDLGVDYYTYDVSDILTSEPQNAIVNAVFPNGAGGANNCATVDPTFLADHFVFNGACSAANLAKVQLLRINGPQATFSGVDFRASYRFDDVFGGALTLGGVGNQTLTYSFDAFSVAGLAVAGFDAVGKLNAGTLAHTLPEWKWQGFVNYDRGPLNLRWSVRYNSGYIDQRQGLTAIGRTIEATTLHDVALVLDLPRNVTFSMAVSNVFDEEPPLARVAEGYDAMTSDPLGRTIRTGLRMTF